ncbi:hypothetical protein ZIOFF_040065 [Zingiber officinale]|uniref:Uncharacterized protein n=1 Tax=Zingiber officinale TaxID=94328 RepID=A0A8J5GGY8_ZINOF|nr:hypothetical protein ZIOFF_040065 [Zingiber officinale]
MLLAEFLGSRSPNALFFLGLYPPSSSSSTPATFSYSSSPADSFRDCSAGDFSFSLPRLLRRRFLFFSSAIVPRLLSTISISSRCCTFLSTSRQAATICSSGELRRRPRGLRDSLKQIFLLPLSTVADRNLPESRRPAGINSLLRSSSISHSDLPDLLNPVT